MSQVAWRLDQQLANLSCGPLAAGVDLFSPCRGLTELRWGERSLAGLQILGVDLESLDGPTAPALVERYVRGGDLVGTYEQTPTRPFRVQIYWRAMLLDLDGDSLPAVDLQVSTQTNLLDSRPLLSAASVVPCCETVELTGGTIGGVACGRLIRPEGFDVSYAQLVHPDDFHGAALAPLADGRHRLVARLFGGALEKGVILRARVRGVFVPRPIDESLAAAAFGDFVRQPPPLTT